MSLINDVLKDLERRDASDATQTPRPVERRRPISTSGAWKWPLWLIAALALGVILHLSLNPGSPSNASSETPPLVAQADSLAEPEPAAATDQGDVNEHTAPSTPTDAHASTSAPVEPAQIPAQSATEALVHSSESQRREQAPQVAAASDDPPQPEQPTISIRRSDEGPDTSDPLAAAKRFLARGQFQRAESRLRKLIVEQPALTEAHELLANTLIRQRQRGAAVRMLETGLNEAKDPSPLAALLGRLLMERGELGRASAVLQEHAPALADAPDYHLLLAAVHRQSGDHEAAARHYRKLTGILPRRGAVWIGLGASLESLQRPEEAVAAYNRALEGDDTRAARFARQRLNALEPITGESQ